MTSTKALRGDKYVSNIFADDIKLDQISKIFANRYMNFKSVSE